MRLPRLFALLAGLLLGLAACGQLPRPFDAPADPRVNPLALPDTGAVLLVQPLAPGSSGDNALAARLLAEELDRIGLPATTGAAHRYAPRVLGSAEVTPIEGNGDRVTLTWVILDGEGAPLGRHAHALDLPAGLWMEGSESALRLAAQDAAPAIAEIVQPAPVPEARLQGWPPGVHLVVAEIPEGPADSTGMLAEALRESLRALDLPLRSRAGPGDIVISGRIETGRPADGLQPVSIIWEVSRDGEPLGDLEQTNAMPVDAVRGSWSAIAPAIAEAAVPGLDALLAEAAAERAQTQGE